MGSDTIEVKSFDPFPKSWKKVIHPQRKKIIVENFVSRLHFHITVSLLMASIALICSITYFGATINCSTFAKEPAVPDKALNAFCFIGNTYTIVPQNPKMHAEFMSPGVGFSSAGDKIERQTYYQWVPFVLMLQAIFFYLPHYLRKMFDDGYVNKVVKDLQGIVMTSHDEKDYVIGEEKKDKKEGEEDERIRVYSQKTLTEKLTKLSTHYKTMLEHQVHLSWACAILVCEVVNMIVVIGQIWYMNKFLHGSFLSLGWKMMFPEYASESEEGGITALETLFPKMAKCELKVYGPSGSLQNYDAACLLSLNQINERIFLAMWYCLVALFVLNIMNLLMRFCQFLLYREMPFSSLWLNKKSTDYLNKRDLNAVLRQHKTFADWMLLQCIGDNMDPNLFGQLLVQLKDGITKRDNYGGEVVVEELEPLNDYSNVNMNATFGLN